MNEASWFPVDLHVPQRRFEMLTLGAEVLERSVFLDTRIHADLSAARSLDADCVQVTRPERLGWLFHTSFCASTLLARALHDPLDCMVLKEPLILRRLGDARHSGWPVPFGDLIKKSASLLGRAWKPGGAVMVKPTHAALNIAVDSMACTPGSRAVVLTSSLRDFLVSNIKKTSETQDKIGLLAERALRASAYHARLPAAAFSPPDMLCAAALQWAAQREVVADLLQAAGRDRVRVLDIDEMAQDLHSVVDTAAAWLGIDAGAARRRARVDDVQSRNAKAVTAPYDFAQRERDVRMLESSFGRQLAHALQWHEQHLQAAMRPIAVNPETHWRLMRA